MRYCKEDNGTFSLNQEPGKLLQWVRIFALLLVSDICGLGSVMVSRY
jgi:hypothetical protein